MSAIGNKTEFQMTKPPPPPYLSKETLIIWESWSKMGDKEVTRESAAKGSHIDLAKTFLSQRKGVCLKEAEDSFNDEIRSWASELLTNKQVFRASHILTNIKLDPVSEIQEIFCDTANKDLRDYLGTHLDKVGSLEGNLKQSWNLLKIIESSQDSDFGFGDGKQLNVRFISSKDKEWKSRISSKLFLNSFNFDLTSFIEPLHLWQTALIMNNCNILIVWINTQYSSEIETNTNTDLLEYLVKTEIDLNMLKFLFESSEIKQNELQTSHSYISTTITSQEDKIHNIGEDFSGEPESSLRAAETIENCYEKSGICSETKSIICDNLAKFGIFDPQEENDLCKIITRINNIEEIHNLDKILNSHIGNLSKEKLQSLIFEYCLKNELYIIMDVCTKNYNLVHENNQNIALITSNRTFIKNINEKDNIVNNLSLVMSYLGDTADQKIKFIVQLFLSLLKKEDLFSAICNLEKDLNKLNNAVVKSNLHNVEARNCNSDRLEKKTADHNLESVAKSSNIQQSSEKNKTGDFIKIEQDLENGNCTIEKTKEDEVHEMLNLDSLENKNYNIESSDDICTKPYFDNSCNTEGEDLMMGSCLVNAELRVLNKIFKKAMHTNEHQNITFYDLVETHLNLNPQKVFPYSFGFSNDIPHFNFKPLVEQHGFRKKLSFEFYLLENRPSKACLMFEETLTENELSGFKENVIKLAVNNFTKKNVGASCVAFLEMIGESSEMLRNDLKIAYLLWNSGMFRKEADVCRLMLQKDFHKESVFVESDEGGVVLRNESDVVLRKDFRDESVVMIQKDDSLVSILETVESTIYSQLDLVRNKRDVIDALKIFEVFYKYAENNVLKLPDVLLKTFAKNDQWLIFLITIQKYNYPQEQLIKLVQHFKSPQLLEHVSHCILHDIHYEHKTSIMRERDSRNYFLSRIGVRKQRDDSMTTSATSQSSYGSTSSSGMSDYSDVEMPDLGSVDLLQVLIKCHNNGDPPKALLHACVHYKYPLFAVLATCYEPDSVIINWLTWLGVTCDINQTECYDSIALVGNDVISFMRTMLQHGYYKTLKQSFEIFLSDNPLNTFISMLSDCISTNYKSETLEEKLSNFHGILKSCNGNHLISEIDVELTYLNNKIWIESAALMLLSSALQYCFKTIYNKIHFLKTINEINMQNYFTTALPNFVNVEKILNYLFKAQINVSIDFFKMCNIETHKDEIIACIDRLVKMNMFEEALKVADIAESAADAILSKKWKLIFSEKGIGDTLHECDAEFKKLKMIPLNAVLFYTQFPMDDPHDKYRLLSLAYQWASENQLEEELSLEYDMWRAYLKLNDSYQNEIKYKYSNLKLYADMKVELERFGGKVVYLDNHEVNRLDLLIDQLLGTGDVFQAFKLEKMFRHNNANLEVLRLCFNLAEGLKLPFQLSTEERLLLRKRSNFRSFSHRVKSLRPARLSSLSSAVSRSPGTLSVNTVLEVEAVVEDTITLIENLIDGLTSGLEIGQNILMIYRISINIDNKYSTIVEAEDPETILMDALENNCKNKLEVVHDFITVYKWSKQKIAHFLCEQIIFMIIHTTEKKENSSELWDINLNTDIHLILQLLPDSCSILGKALYTYASALHKSQTVSINYPDSNEITHVVELLIRAHDCYTADCNMEGISVILKKCQTLINLLLTLKNWYLIVRLLTGVARYNELNYVFHILRENDQFEYLLRRGKSTRDNGLKVALLEYLKRYCPDNRELYKMVALHFSLYSEVAQLWENESASIIRNLIAISKLEMQNRKVNPDTCLLVELTNTDGTKLCLNKAMENYTHASEYHLEGDKLAKAMSAARRAELVALQMSLLKGLPNSGTANCILNLNSSQINILILQELSFPQALILTEAYEHPIDWATVLFEQYIMNNKSNYLANYLSVFSLNDSLVYDISRRFLNGNINDDSAIHNMKTLLRMLPSVHTKYRVASELGFLDIVEDLLNTNKLMYLKDTVWKKGYKN